MTSVQVRLYLIPILFISGTKEAQRKEGKLAGKISEYIAMSVYVSQLSL